MYGMRKKGNDKARLFDLILKYAKSNLLYALKYKFMSQNFGFTKKKILAPSLHTESKKRLCLLMLNSQHTDNVNNIIETF